MANLPSEMMDEIFLRLPAKSLAQFESLNHSRHTRIQSCNFVRSHTQQHANTIKSKKVIFYASLYREYYPMYSYSVSSYAQGRGETMDDVQHSFEGLYEIVGSCDGILLVLFKDPYKLGIWNPLTREYRQLPPCKQYRYFVVYGFGCVSSSEKERYDNYKVIQIEITSDVLSRVIQYTTRTNSWKLMKSIPYSSCWWQSILVNSKLHFIFMHKNGHKTLEILALDITDEEFVVVPLPDIRDSFYLHNIAELSGNLCLVSCKPEMMKDSWCERCVGDEGIWCERFLDQNVLYSL